MIAIVLAGLLASQFLAVSSVPNVDYPTLQVQTFYPGASPEVVTATVTAPLERALGEMEGLREMASSSSAGASIITLTFDLPVRLDVAEEEVQAAINAAGDLLPSDLPAPPIYAKINPADAPIITLAITSKHLPLMVLENIANSRLANELSEIPGVGQVNIAGGNAPAVRLEVNPMALAQYGLSIDDIRTQIGNLNVDMPKGSFTGRFQSYTINANDQVEDASAYTRLIMAYRDGAPVFLGEVAKTIAQPQDQDLRAWVNETPAIILNIQRQPGSNAIATVDAIKRELPMLTAGLPADLQVRVVGDSTTSIRASLADAKFELCLSILFVVAVIFAFLRNLRATLIPAMSVPISLIGTLAVMYFLNFTIDNISLMALIVATGFVVDDSIVMVENIARYIEMGESSMQAALHGAGQIGFTIISLTVSLIAVLIPLLFMGDVVGRLFSELAVTIAVTTIISAIVSLTVVPMLCSRLLVAKADQNPNKFERWTMTRFEAVISAYGRGLGWTLARPRLTLAVALAAFVAAVILYIYIPKGFFPVQDTGVIEGFTQASESTSFDEMAAHQQRLAAAILKDRDVVSLTSYIGIDGTNPTLNTGRFLINLTPKGHGRPSASAIIRRLSQEAAGVSGINLFMQPVQHLNLNSTVSPAQYQLTLQDADPAEFSTYVPALLRKLQALPQLADVASDLQDSGLAVDITINRTSAARFGITPATVDNALYDAFGQRIISTIFTQSDQYRVIMGVDPALSGDVSSLARIYLLSPAASGGEVPLSAIASFSVGRAPLVIEHLGQLPATTLSFNLASGASLAGAVKNIKAAEKSLNFPASLSTQFEGAALAFQSSFGHEVFLVIAALVTVYIVLGVLYESFVHPVTILSTLPSAGIGALVFLWLAGDGLGVIGVIGIVLLIGIVKKNAILMIDFALQAERIDGKQPRDAIREACLLRFRPIMMTTLAAMLAALPLMLGGGMGAELRAPLGVAIVGGLLVSQALTLFTTPVVYLFFDRIARRLRLA